MLSWTSDACTPSISYFDSAPYVPLSRLRACALVGILPYLYFSSRCSARYIPYTKTEVCGCGTRYGTHCHRARAEKYRAFRRPQPVVNNIYDRSFRRRRCRAAVETSPVSARDIRAWHGTECTPCICRSPRHFIVREMFTKTEYHRKYRANLVR